MNITIIGYKIAEQDNGNIYIEEQMETMFPIKNETNLEHAMFMADISDGNGNNDRHNEIDTWYYETINPSYTIAYLFFDEDTPEEVMADSIEYTKQTIINNV